MLKKILNNFSSAHHNATKFGMVIHNCKTIFEQYYINSSVEFVRRQTNETTHKLTNMTTFSVSF